MTRKKKKKKRSWIGNFIPARYRSHPAMIARWMNDIDKYARKKKTHTPRVLKHPHN